jgi:hypothetical protein
MGSLGAAGLPGRYDLRHTGQTLATSTGPTIKDLIRRLGHGLTSSLIPVPARRRWPRPEIAAALSDDLRPRR